MATGTIAPRPVGLSPWPSRKCNQKFATAATPPVAGRRFLCRPASPPIARRLRMHTRVKSVLSESGHGNANSTLSESAGALSAVGDHVREITYPHTSARLFHVCPQAIGCPHARELPPEPLGRILT